MEENPINLTPLIDVVFVILILFIVVAPLLETERIALAPGNADNVHHFTTEEQSSLCIRAFANDTLTLNQRPISLLQLEQLLPSIHQRFPEARPQLYQDKNARFGTYQAIKNAVEKAGFAEMDLILQPE